jgi:TolA-binding protein
MEAESTQSTGSTDTFYKVLGWLHAYRKRLLTGAIAAAIIGLIAGAVAWKKDQNEADANAKLFALSVSGAAGPRAAAPPTPGAFLDVATSYPSTSAGEYAELLAAESLFVDGSYPQAQHEFSRFIDQHPESALVPQAKVGVASSLEAQGKVPEAIQKYQEILSGYPGEYNIVSPARLTLARLFEQQNKPDQALKLYSELAGIQNPYDPWASEARERGMLLLAKHPELRQMLTPPTAAPEAFPLTRSASATPAAIPAPAAPASKPPVNLLNIPALSTNSAPKP